jgi:hypothetical protein
LSLALLVPLSGMLECFQKQSELICEICGQNSSLFFASLASFALKSLSFLCFLCLFVAINLLCVLCASARKFFWLRLCLFMAKFSCFFFFVLFVPSCENSFGCGYAFLWLNFLVFSSSCSSCLRARMLLVAAMPPYVLCG